MDQKAHITQLANKARAFLEPHWARWHRKSGSPEGRRTLSEGTCGRSSQFLRDLLRDYGYRAETVFGSPVECNCGFLTDAGWKGHGWVQVENPACIIDLTADQFGAAKVVVTTPDDPRYRAGHDVAGDGWKAERQRVAQALLRDWYAQGLAAGGENASSVAQQQARE